MNFYRAGCLVKFAKFRTNERPVMCKLRILYNCVILKMAFNRDNDNFDYGKYCLSSRLMISRHI